MPTGLSNQQAETLRVKYGYNEIPEKKVSLLAKIFKNIFSPIGLMLIFAAALSFFLGKDFDGNFILVLLILNVAITLWQEGKADQAIQKLNEHLEQKIRVMRDGTWNYLQSRLLVPGDLVQLASGEVVPADGRVEESQHGSLNESAITGESLPKDKVVGDSVYSGSFVASGIITVSITHTGAGTSFGKTLFSVERVRKRSELERDIVSISRFLTILALVAVLILSVVFILKRAPFLELLTLDLSLIIAGIPVSLPTVMTLIIEFGVLALAKKEVIIRRLSALEDLANVTYLLTDKTGTLTKNHITVQDLYSYGTFNHDDILTYAATLAQYESDNPIDGAISARAREGNIPLQTIIKKDFTPADSERKRSTLVATREGKPLTITVGAPQIVATLATMPKDEAAKYALDVQTLASSGYRTLAVAYAEGEREERMRVVGLIALSDTLRDDAPETLQFLEENGVDVTMVTGDNRAIAGQIANKLHLKDGKVMTKDELDRVGLQALTAQFFAETGAFAEVLPADKFHLVEAAKRYFVVAANGDGINDLPAVKSATVGMAVSNAVTALKATADIVLLSPGIAVIKDAIIESRKIFERIYTYSLYRISESLRLIVTIAILGILYGVYPMTALQIILIAFLNDIPIISLAFDRIRVTKRPAKINAKVRFTLSSLYGLTGVANSLLLFYIMSVLFHLSWPVIQTMYFLKMTVSGHMLIYVAHTKERWWKFLPSSQVIWATTLTQLVATALAATGFLMPGHLSLWQIVFVWGWALVFMQVSELMKILYRQR